jgi:cytochrome c biogenesis protein
MNAIRNSEERLRTERKTSAVDKTHSVLVSTRLSLFVFVLIAAGSILGTFIKQGGAEEEYLAVYSENTYKIIKLFSLNDVYHSAWFYTLIGLFTLNLALCTIRQLARLIKERRRTEIPVAEKLRAMECNTLVSRERKEEAVKEIKKTYVLVHEDEKGILFEKGAFSRWGVSITHGSIIVILMGALAGLIFGSRGLVVLGVGETKNHMTTEGANSQEKALGFAIKCKDFRASFYPNGAPKDYVSAIEIIDGGIVVLEKNIRVNDPLYYKGVRVYQSGYGEKRSFAFSVGDEEVVLTEQETIKKGKLVLTVARFESEVHNFGPGVQIVYIEEGEPKSTWFLPNINRLRSQTIQGVNVKLVNIQQKPYTRLEATNDPGVFIVWAGFALILFGLYVTFFTYYRRIFIVYIESGALMAGYALKNKDLFKKEFEKLKEDTRDNG